MFRGWIALDGQEIANSSRVSAHLGAAEPLSDAQVFGGGGDCALVEVSPGLVEVPDSCVEVLPGLVTAPDGARRYGPGLLEVGPQCWGDSPLCGCRFDTPQDDSWPGLPDLLGDEPYRLELAPWFSTVVPESAEFGGVWLLDAKGMDSTPVARDVVQAVGDGGVAGPSRDTTRTVRFEALLVACSHAGAVYGLRWLNCRLRDATGAGSVMRFLAAHPGGSAADPGSLWRELHGMVLTRAVEVEASVAVGQPRYRQASVLRVSWEMVATSPHVYLPAVTVPVRWDEIAVQPITWVHDRDCARPDTCADPMPVLWSTECVPERIEVQRVPPPVCGGCLPVGGLASHRWRLDATGLPSRCRETAVSVTIRNTGSRPLNLQGFWRPCGTDVRCGVEQFPVQVSGLPVDAELVLDGVTGRARAWFDNRWHRPAGIVGTPNGSPWRPPLIDRQTCWELVAQTAATADFQVSVTLADREP
jgi:hypothetical protein